MAVWSDNPTIYEINTCVWLSELSQRYGRIVTLGTVPDAEWDDLSQIGVDAIWLMGVWQRSHTGKVIADQTAALTDEFRRALPDFTEADNIGSPYCVQRYVADDGIGGSIGLAAARGALRSRDLRLILDYVPNHVALDHPWIRDHPEFFIRGDEADIEHDPEAFFKVLDFAADEKIFARGRDPNFPPWPDVAQLNAFSVELRTAVIETVSSIADQCDGMRCDMAMLMMTDIFQRTWGNRAGEPPSTEFWPEVIGAVKQRHPEVLFIAEAYWDMEYALQAQGFDYCYDKRLYDRLVNENAASVRGHLMADIDYQRRLVRFIENHDEPRAAAVLIPEERQRAAAAVILTLPGARMLHQGQFEGRQTRIPVFLRRGPDELQSSELARFYGNLLSAIRVGIAGDWHLCDVRGWPDNQSCANLLAWTWQEDDRYTIVVVNYAAEPSQGLVELRGLAGGTWNLDDPIASQTFVREGADLNQNGLFIDLGPWGVQFLIGSRAMIPAGVEPARG